MSFSALLELFAGRMGVSIISGELSLSLDAFNYEN